MIREQADFADSEVGEDLSAEADGAEDALRMSGTLAGAVGAVWAAAVEGEATGDSGDACGNVAVDAEAALGMVQVDEGAAAGFGDLTERGVECGVAIAESRAEDIAGEAVSLNADEDGFVGGV